MWSTTEPRVQRPMWETMLAVSLQGVLAVSLQGVLWIDTLNLVTAPTSFVHVF